MLHINWSKRTMIGRLSAADHKILYSSDQNFKLWEIAEGSRGTVMSDEQTRTENVIIKDLEARRHQVVT
jgi:hypothetical protein